MAVVSETVICGVCNELLDFLTLDERQAHYDMHFNDPGPSSHNSLPKQKFRKAVFLPPPKENTFWHAFQQTLPPKNYTPGLIPVLKRTFTRLHARGLTTRVVLCADGICHVGTEWFDLGWGCGYRNFLMACTSLIAQQRQPMYFPLLDIANGSVSPAGSDLNGNKEMTGPGVRGLQAWIENAWHNGYDLEGANDKSMNWRLVGTRKFIGTSDISVAFTACGIPCNLVDFPKPRELTKKLKFQPRLNEPTAETSATSLIRWIVNYFDNVPQPGMPNGLEPRDSPLRPNDAFDRMKPEAVIVSPRMPIILQHNGHSRTIIGYEMIKSNTINLLIFDPAPQKRPDSALRKAALETHRQDSSACSPMSAFHHSPSSSNRSPESKTSRILQHIRHLSPSTLSNRRRQPSPGPKPPKADGLETERPTKRFRGDGPVHEPANRDKGNAFEIQSGTSFSGGNREDDEVVEIPRPANNAPLSGGTTNSGRPLKTKTEAEGLCDALDPVKVARLFRVNNATLSLKDQYQILFFPLTDPLTDFQKEQRRVVTSTPIAPMSCNPND